MARPATLLSALAMPLFAMAMLLHGHKKKGWPLLYFAVLAFYAVLYYRRRLRLGNQRGGGLFIGLGYIAVVLSLLLSAAFFYNVGAGMPLPLAIGVWLGLAFAAYYFYRVIVLHLDVEVMQVQARLLSALAAAFVHLLFATAMLLHDDHGHKRKGWTLAYLLVLAIFGALYFRRRFLLHHQLGGIYQGLGHTAAMHGALLSALFLYAAGAAGTTPSLAVCVWVGLAIAAYFFYRILVLHLEGDGEVDVQAQGARRPPV